MNRRAVLRVLDANTNRALEGVRVCEDIVRFSLQSPRRFAALRRLRHAIARAVRRLPLTPAALLQVRESRRDIGRQARATRVRSLDQLLLINFQRAKEALRVLEECTRMIAPRHTAVFQRLRFRIYQVERETLLGLDPLRHR